MAILASGRAEEIKNARVDLAPAQNFPRRFKGDEMPQARQECTDFRFTSRNMPHPF